MKAALLFLVLGLMALCFAKTPDHAEDDHDEFLEFDERLNMFAKLRAHSEEERKPLTREQVLAALKEFLPNDPDLWDPALEELVQEMLGKGHQKGKGHQSGQAEGRYYRPEEFGRHFGRDFPLPR